MAAVLTELVAACLSQTQQSVRNVAMMTEECFWKLLQTLTSTDPLSGRPGSSSGRRKYTEYVTGYETNLYFQQKESSVSQECVY
ncbi:uncharacterized protein V6R79_017960 [Siganus canaliculatus]